MDVFADVIPGIVVLMGLVLVTAQAGVFTPVVNAAGLAVGVVLSLVIGRVLQFVAAPFTLLVSRFKAISGGPRLGLMNPARELKTLHDYDDKTTLQEGFWHHCQERLGFPESGSTIDEYEELWRALLTYLESTTYSQTVRIQVLSAMTRGLWSGFGLLTVVYLALLWFPTHATVDLSNPALRYEALIAGLLTLVFWTLESVFKRLSLTYMLVEFYLDQTMREHETSP
jgi:hypothetical protein